MRLPDSGMLPVPSFPFLPTVFFLIALTPFNHSSCKKFLMKPGSQHSMLWHFYYVCVYIACKYISNLPSFRCFSSLPPPYIQLGRSSSRIVGSKVSHNFGIVSGHAAYSLLN